MTVYQIRVHGGEWEDKYDYDVATYLSKQRAEEELVALNNEVDKESKRYNEYCIDCFDLGECDCQYKDIVYDDADIDHKYPYCSNEVLWTDLDVTFYIKAIEVIE